MRWFKGINEIVAGSSGFEHVHFNLDSKELEFRGVKASDNSGGYFCEVNVSRADGFYHRQGATIALSITGEYGCYVSYKYRDF